MNILSVFLVCLSQIISSFFSQEVFEIKGTSAFYDNKELIIEPVLNNFIDSGYVACEIISREDSYPINIVQIKDRKFSVKGLLEYPVPFSVSFYNQELNLGHTSEPFFVEKGLTSIHIKDLSSHLGIKTDLNKSNVEYELIKIKTGWSYYSANDIEHPQKGIIQQELGRYISDNPTSHVAMWLLIMSYIQDGYSDQINENSNYFAPEIKRLAPFTTFKEKLRVDKKIYASTKEKTQPFPFDEFKIGSEIRSYIVQNKYTLIDYWATWCKPCILQIDSLKAIHEKYHNYEFNLLSISVDSKQKENKAIDVLSSKSVKWPNVFDYDGLDFNKFTNVLPFNFLIDQNGNIIDKNISVDQLDDFLFKELIK